MLHGADDTATLTRPLPDEAATRGLGAALGRALTPGLVVYLDGDLGAGKTTLVRGLLEGQGYGGKVKSPTYTLVELYATSRLNLHHFDFYRFNQPDEYLDAGLDEYFQGDAVCLVEWPDKAAPHLPAADIRVVLHIEEPARRAEIAALSEAGRACLEKLRASFSPPS